MASSSRFPHLALPFSFVGAAGGWLSVSFLSNPLVRMTWPGKEWVAAIIAMVLAGAAGALLTRFCAGQRYAYQLDTPEPDVRLTSDSWPRHIATVLLAGALTGLAVSVAFDTYRGPIIGSLCGLCCAIAFVPVCAMVIVTARRAQRARLGSIVSASDRRAVWSILATALSVTTLEAAPNWTAALAKERDFPLPALVMWGCSALVIGWVLAMDVRAHRAAKRATAEGLTAAEDDGAVVEADISKLDLGLGDGSWERRTRSASAYRGRDRTLALVQGDPAQALWALRRAARRGMAGLAIAAVVLLGHGAFWAPAAQQTYAEKRCEADDFAACTRAAEGLRERSLARAVGLYRRACDGSDAQACSALAHLFEQGAPPSDPIADEPADRKETEDWAAYYHRRACETGVVSSCSLRGVLSYRPSHGYRPWVAYRAM